MNKWEAAVLDGHLLNSLNFLDLPNSISSLIADLGSSQLSLSLTVSLVSNSPSSAIERLEQIEPRSAMKISVKGSWKEFVKRGGGLKEVQKVNDTVADLFAALDIGKASYEHEELEKKI
ncbi:hypothetical protein Ancab_006514 [Ancistrocladus abbreviatus]